MATNGSIEASDVTGEWFWEQRVEAAAEHLVEVCWQIRADWWPTTDAECHLLIVEALSRSAELLLAEQPTLPFD